MFFNELKKLRKGKNFLTMTEEGKMYIHQVVAHLATVQQFNRKNGASVTQQEKMIDELVRRQQVSGTDLSGWLKSKMALQQIRFED